MSIPGDSPNIAESLNKENLGLNLNTQNTYHIKSYIEILHLH